MIFTSKDFTEFIDSNCNRCQFITSKLKSFGVNSTVLSIDDRRHVLVQFPSSAYNPQFKIKTVLVHYDRAEGSPGANDNSAAVLQIMDWSIRLASFSGNHNVRIFFTDGEELGSGGVSEQGAFGIASTFRRLGITKDDVYVFDCCGRGTIPVLSQAGIGSGNLNFKEQFNSLIQRTQDLLSTVSPHWLTLPIPYSDNAGFLACGIPAVAITLLPSEEATTYLYTLGQNSKLKEYVVSGKTKLKEMEIKTYYNLLPKTWRLLHTSQDDISTLNKESFILMEKLLNALATTKTLA